MIHESGSECLKAARKLENEIDQKLLTFSNTITKLSSSQITNGDEMVQNIVKEVDDMLKKLSQLNDQMSIIQQEDETDTTMIHTIQRHRENLADYRKEFKRAKTNAINTLNRMKILSGGSDLQTSYEHDSSIARNSRLSAEGDHVIRIDRTAQQIIENASHIKESLGNQRQSFSNSLGSLSGLRANFPIMGGLMTRISQRRRRDMIILSLVIAICIIILFFMIK